MKILAILQNQWFKDPEGIKAMYEENPERRNRYIEAFLFMGCLTGKRLQKAFGEGLCQQIIWEEASPKIAGRASDFFPPDPIHIRQALLTHKPNIVLVFGKIAMEGICGALGTHSSHTFIEGELRIDLPSAGLDKLIVIVGPHPAARTDPMPRLIEMAERIKVLILEQNPA